MLTEGVMMSERCECHKCIEDNNLTVTLFGVMPVALSSVKMILCPKCGNKRCPKASNHRLECTGSNKPGQEGSVYSSSYTEGEK